MAQLLIGPHFIDSDWARAPLCHPLIDHVNKKCDRKSINLKPLPENKLLGSDEKDKRICQNSMHGLLLALEQFIEPMDTNVKLGSLEVTLINELGHMNNASAAIAIGILTKLNLSENSQDHVMSYIRKRIECSSRYTEIAEMDLFNSISEYLIQNRAKCMPEILSILSNRSKQESSGSFRRVFSCFKIGSRGMSHVRERHNDVIKKHQYENPLK